MQAGTIEEEELLGAASADDGSVVLAGLTYGDLSGTNQGSSDFAAFKVDSSGMTEWTWQVGVVKRKYRRFAQSPATSLAWQYCASTVVVPRQNTLVVCDPTVSIRENRTEPIVKMCLWSLFLLLMEPLSSLATHKETGTATLHLMVISALRP